MRPACRAGPTYHPRVAPPRPERTRRSSVHCPTTDESAAVMIEGPVREGPSTGARPACDDTTDDGGQSPELTGRAGHRVSTPELGPRSWLLHRRGSTPVHPRTNRVQSPGGQRRPTVSDPRRDRRQCGVEAPRRSHPLRSTVEPPRGAEPWVTNHRSSAGSRALRTGPKPRAFDTGDRKVAPSPAPRSRGGVHVPMGPGSSSRASNLASFRLRRFARP